MKKIRMKYCLMAVLLFSFVTLAKENQVNFCFDLYPPMHELNKDGKEGSGIIIELFISLMLHIGYKNNEINLIQLPWQRCQQYVKEGVMDVMITMPNDIRSEYATPSSLALYSMALGVYTSKSNQNINEIANFKLLSDINKTQLTIATYRGNGWFDKYITVNTQNIAYVSDINKVFLILDKNRADFTVSSLITAKVQLEKLKLSSRIIHFPINDQSIDFHFMVSKKSKEAGNRLKIDKINKGIGDLITSGKFNSIITKYEH